MEIDFYKMKKTFEDFIKLIKNWSKIKRNAMCISLCLNFQFILIMKFCNISTSAYCHAMSERINLPGKTRQAALYASYNIKGHCDNKTGQHHF